MNRYWLAQNGETTGPFAEEVLLSMWQHGKMQREAQVCQEGTEDWLDGRFVINELELAKESAAKAVQVNLVRTEQRQKEARRVLREKSKSQVGAFFLSWIFPGLGHFYCGYAGQAVLLMLLAVALLFIDFTIVGGLFFFPFAVLLSCLAAVSAAKRRNQQLEDELGL